MDQRPLVAVVYQLSGFSSSNALGAADPISGALVFFFLSINLFAIAIVYYYIDGLSQKLSSQVTVAKVLQDWTMPLKQKRIHQHVSCLDDE